MSASLDELPLSNEGQDWLVLVRNSSCHQTPEIQAAWKAIGWESWRGHLIWYITSPYGLRDVPSKMRRAIKRFWQRGWRGWSDQDTWSFDQYLAEVIAGGVARLASRDFAYKEGYGGPEGWRNILEELAEGFAHYSVDDPCDLDCPKVKRSLELFVELFPGLWD